MNTQQVLRSGITYLDGLSGHIFDVIDIARPVSPEAASNLAKVISKLSPFVGNLIEFNVCDYLNSQPGFDSFGRWVRQDPGFPGTIFQGRVNPAPGFEIKTWLPLATEITARFKDSQDHFSENQTYVVMLAWLPEHLIFERPRLIDIAIISGASIAKTCDDHYHNPPDSIVMEPENTSDRTNNLQQTNTGGYKFQGTAEPFLAALDLVGRFNIGRGTYSTAPEYQARWRKLGSMFPYRPDTNFAKMDHVGHDAIRSCVD